MGTQDQLSIEGRNVPASKLDKVLYPAGPFTKAQVIDYYIRVSGFLLPHLKDRPVTLKRYPDGVHGKFFYEKDAPRYTPKWVKTFPVPRRTGKSDIHYVVINDLSTLVWAANIASLEFHPFLHRVPKLQQPTCVIFDLDPGEGVNVFACVDVAFLLKDVLAKVHLDSFPKVSGSKGIQLYVPLNTPVEYTVTRPFARTVAELLAKHYPNQVVSEMAKAERTGKVFIDWSQNADFKTTIGVYSLRAKRSKPFISLPVTWEELSKALQTRDANRLYFEPESALERLEQVGDLFAPVLSLKQSLPDAITNRIKLPTTSALRGRMLGQIASDNDAQRPSNGVPLPDLHLDSLPPSAMTFVEPMQCKLTTSLPEDGDWEYEVKLDGYRALAIKERGQLQLLSRRNNAMNDRFPSIAHTLQDLEDGIIVDGEIVAFDKEGRPSFHILQHQASRKHSVFYYAFDLLAYRRRDVRGLPLWQRRELLKTVMVQAHDPIRVSTVLQAKPKDLIRSVKEHGLEGVIAKQPHSKYETGERSGSWLKYKVNRGQELVIGGYKPGGKGFFENLAVGYYDHDRLIFIAKIKNGFTPTIKQKLSERFKGLETRVCPFSNLPEPKNARRGQALTAEAMKNYRWLRPELVAQIEFTEWTSTDRLRHSKFVALRDDKRAHQVVHETAD